MERRVKLTTTNMEITYRKNEAGKLEKKTVIPSTPQVTFEEWTLEFINQSIARHQEKVAGIEAQRAAQDAQLAAELAALEALRDKADELDVT
jgi:hypothetical protein